VVARPEHNLITTTGLETVTGFTVGIATLTAGITGFTAGIVTLGMLTTGCGMETATAEGSMVLFFCFWCVPVEEPAEA
jgi:hypothetical protein